MTWDKYFRDHYEQENLRLKAIIKKLELENERIKQENNELKQEIERYR